MRYATTTGTTETEAKELKREIFDGETAEIKREPFSSIAVKPKRLVDDYGRRIRKLRVSLLDACNFRCFYCMPEDVQFKSNKNWLSPQEITNISSTLVDYGVEELRLTGGEPLMRKEFREIVMSLSDLNIKKLGVTTNAFYLEKELDFLKDTKCKYINISLDSLNKEKFDRITKRKSFDRVFSAVKKAAEGPFKIKLNTVLLKGINDNEIIDFIKFSEDHNVEVRFLEMMKIGQACGTQDDLYISAGDILKRLSDKVDLQTVPMEKDSTSFNYKTSKGGQIGFIAAESKAFCGSCSRWRMSADGFLRACLMSNKGMSLKGKSIEECDHIFSEVLKMKPINRIESISQDMNQIGG